VKTVKSMAAQYTDVSLVEMEATINRAFHSLHPRKGALKGEVVFDLFLSPKVGVRVWSSISEHGTTGAGVGADAIRVQLYNFEKGRPLKPGKAPIVKRTQGWKDNLRERVEDEIEDYDSQEENIEAGKFITWTK
jgi:hypothetical protein